MAGPSAPRRRHRARRDALARRRAQLLFRGPRRPCAGGRHARALAELLIRFREITRLGDIPMLTLSCKPARWSVFELAGTASGSENAATGTWSDSTLVEAALVKRSGSA